MGHAKEVQLQEDSQGWSFSDKWVCTGCVSDYALEAVIESAADNAERCSFCGNSPAAELDVLSEAFMEGIRSEFGNADDEGVYYDSSEGGYQWHRTWDTWDLLDDFWDVLTGEGLLDEMREVVHDTTWVERNFATPRRDEALLWSWSRFCHALKHESRYVFWLLPDPDEKTADYTGEVPASRILDQVVKLLMDFDLVRVLPAEGSFWRARPHLELQPEWGAENLGTVPVEKAKYANRMSPSGIALFYGSEDQDTAIAEVVQNTDDPWVSVGLFETSRDCTIVDFTKLPAPPSMFDERNRHRRRPLLFLRRFVSELRKPARSEWQPLDYVPTQVLTEFLLRVFLRGEVVAGLLYPSAVTGNNSIALDVQHDDCVEQSEGWKQAVGLRLGFVPGSRQTHAQWGHESAPSLIAPTGFPI